jgi:membrane fusion protein, multidrug efflux system
MSGLRRHLGAILTAGAVTVGLTIGGAYWWHQRQTYAVTNNAFVQADKVTISPLVEGYVTEVLVKDNQAVQAGQLLVRIDAESLTARLAQAEADAQALEAAVQGVDDKAALQEALVAQKAAGLDSSRAQAGLAAAELDRYNALASQGWVPPQRAQTARAAQDQAQAGVAQARATLEAERRAAKSLGSARAQTVAQAAGARARVNQMRIDLAHTELRAPISGVVGARSIRVGQYVRPGGMLLSIVPLSEAYVIANFKETQLARIRIGQPVEIRADAFGGKTIRGRVDSFSPATGSEFAMIPVENAVGNFTKIAQRLPVKINVERDQALAGALRPGLSVEVKVTITENTGPGFADAAGLDTRLARQGASR